LDKKGVKNRFANWEDRSRNFAAWAERIEPLKVGVFTIC
jgi:hypothetical protein